MRQLCSQRAPTLVCPASGVLATLDVLYDILGVLNPVSWLTSALHSNNGTSTALHTLQTH